MRIARKKRIMCAAKMHLAAFRLLIPALALLAQIYLFIRARQAILSLHWSDRAKSRVIRVMGVAIGLLIAMNGFVLARPAVWGDPPIAVRAVLFYLPAVWTLGSIFSAFFLLMVQIVRGLARMIGKLGNGLAGQNPSLPDNPDRRRFLRAGVAGLATAPFLVAGHGAVYGSKVSEVREIALPFGRPLKVVQLTDIHAGIDMTPERNAPLCGAGYRTSTGPLCPDRRFHIELNALWAGVLRRCARVRSRYGTFATLGNHENWLGRPGEFQAIFRRYGIPLLVNTHQVIETGGAFRRGRDR